MTYQIAKDTDNGRTIFRYPNQPEMQAEVILASQPTNGAPPLYTLRLRYPRIIHAEIMTHRVFSRNARSSRAVPVKTMIQEVRTKPFVPWHWGKNQKGMQAGEYWDAMVEYRHLENIHVSLPEIAWKNAAEAAANYAEAFADAGYHKQICNRLLEPFMWIDTLITSTDWANFLWLRDHKDAEPHLQDLARLVGQALDAAKPQMLQPDQWHLPYITEADVDWAFNMRSVKRAKELLCKLSAARCARISYKPFDGDASYERELERYDGLVKSDRVHASPLEHACTPDDRSIEEQLSTPLHGNLARGWIQYRKLIPNEAVS